MSFMAHILCIFQEDIAINTSNQEAIIFSGPYENIIKMIP